jgi:hypothetical protein
MGKNTTSGNVYNSDDFQENARRGLQKDYAVYRRREIEKGVDLSDFSKPVYLLLYAEVVPTGKYFSRNLLRDLEKRGLSKPFLVPEDFGDILKEISEIIPRKDGFRYLAYEEEVDLTVGPPDEYFVEGIDIDCKSAFESYEKRKKLRESMELGTYDK